jgi:hypothetical protein
MAAGAALCWCVQQFVGPCADGMYVGVTADMDFVEAQWAGFTAVDAVRSYTGCPSAHARMLGLCCF